MIERISSRSPAAIAASIALAFAASSHAQTFPPNNGSSAGFHYTGAPVDVRIPTVLPPDYIRLTIKGGDGGPASKNRCSVRGGRGALMIAEFPIGRWIQPGGTLRILVGQAGASATATTRSAGGGGGGGSGVLYAHPGTSTFFPLAIAAGGGGGHAKTDLVGCTNGHGHDGNFSDCASQSGCRGTGGGSDNTGGGGGGGWHQRGFGSSGGGGLSGNPALSPAGGNGGPAGNNGGRGGFGCGGGGGGHRLGSGGGGGFSGGNGRNDGTAGAGTCYCDWDRVIAPPQYSYSSQSHPDGAVLIDAFSSYGESPANPIVVNYDLGSSLLAQYTSSTQNRLNTIGLESNTLCSPVENNTADEWYRFDNDVNTTRRVTVRGSSQDEFRVMSVVGPINAPFGSCNRLGGPNSLTAQYEVPANTSIYFRVSSLASIGPTVDYTIELEVSEAVLAVEAVRMGDPVNPNAFLPGQTSGPVLGQIWDPIVDHTTFVPDSTVDVALIGSASLEVPVPGFGTLLTNDIFLNLTATPGQAFALPLANDPSALGLRLYVQAASVDANSGVHLTNALDLTIGTH